SPWVQLSWRRSTRSRNRSTSHRSVRAHECVGNSIAVIGIAVLAVLTALLPPARGRRRLHHAAREGGRRRQSPVVSLVARHAKAGAIGGGGRGARTADCPFAAYDGHTIARHAAGSRSRHPRSSPARAPNSFAPRSKRPSSRPSACSRRRCTTSPARRCWE